MKKYRAISRSILICLVVMAVFFLLKDRADTAPFLKTFLHVVFPNLPSAIALIFVWRIIRDPRFPQPLQRSWMLVGTGVFFAIAGDATLTILDNPPVSIADALFMFFYIFTVAGFLSFPYVPITRRERTMLALDIAIILTSCSMILWYFVVDVAEGWAGGNIGVLLNFAYPVGNLVLVAAAVAMFQSGEVDAVELVYTRFVTLGTQEVVNRPLVPLGRELTGGGDGRPRPSRFDSSGA